MNKLKKRDYNDRILVHSNYTSSHRYIFTSRCRNMILETLHLSCFPITNGQNTERPSSFLITDNYHSKLTILSWCELDNQLGTQGVSNTNI